jgi:hypothetical protein
MSAAALPIAGTSQAAPAGLEVALSLPDIVTNGVATTPDGRLFAAIARIDGSTGPRVVENRDGVPVPFPTPPGTSGTPARTRPARWSG